MNDHDSPAYRETDRANLNRPVSELVCPRCEARDVERDYDRSDHPGVFVCRACGHGILA